jgi:hypothetical protein
MRFLGAFLLLLVFAAWLPAQDVRASLNGTVADSSGTVVAIQLPNESAIASFEDSVSQIAGRANPSITSVLPFSEDVISDRARRPQHGRSS